MPTRKLKLITAEWSEGYFEVRESGTVCRTTAYLATSFPRLISSIFPLIPDLWTGGKTACELAKVVTTDD